MSKSTETINRPFTDPIEGMRATLDTPVLSEAALAEITGQIIPEAETSVDNEPATPLTVFGQSLNGHYIPSTETDVVEPKTKSGHSRKATSGVFKLEPVHIPSSSLNVDTEARVASKSRGSHSRTPKTEVAMGGRSKRESLKSRLAHVKQVGKVAIRSIDKLATESYGAIDKTQPRRSKIAAAENALDTPAKQDSTEKKTKRQLVPGELVAVAGKNHSRRVYRIDENGKKRAISQDAVMEIYGTADKTQGKRPRLAATEKVADDLTEKESTNKTPEQTKLAHRLARAKLVGKASLHLIDRVAMAGEKLDTRAGKWAVQKTNGTKLQDKLVQVKEQGTQKGKDITATATTQLEKAKQKRSALWVRMHERKDELSKKAHSFGEKTNDLIKRRRITAAVMAGVLLVSGAVMATSGSDSNEHAKDLTITGSAPQHDTNKPKAAVVPAPVKEAPPAHEVRIPVHKGNLPWDALENVGIPADQIMQRLDAAAKKSGLKYEWHGSGTHKWIEVDGHSDTKTVMNDLDKFIQR